MGATGSRTLHYPHTRAQRDYGTVSLARTQIAIHRTSHNAELDPNVKRRMNRGCAAVERHEHTNCVLIGEGVVT